MVLVLSREPGEEKQPGGTDTALGGRERGGGGGRGGGRNDVLTYILFIL